MRREASARQGSEEAIVLFSELRRPFPTGILMEEPVVQGVQCFDRMYTRSGSQRSKGQGLHDIFDNLEFARNSLTLELRESDTQEVTIAKCVVVVYYTDSYMPLPW